jgi:CDP-diacylglycerol--serine O-phosphatidyltransferase
LRSSRINRISKADIASALNGFSGFIAIMFFVNNYLVAGFLFVTLSILLDGLDGVLARRYGTWHEKGPQIDSIADTISFCIAPSIAIYSAYYIKSEPYSIVSMLTVLSSSVIVFTGIVRLGAFCDEGYALDHFNGLPTPAAALLILSSTLSFPSSPYISIGVAILVSMLMVSPIRYPKMRGRLMVISGALMIILILMNIFYMLTASPWLSWYPWIALIFSSLYLLFGPLMFLKPQMENYK